MSDALNILINRAKESADNLAQELAKTREQLAQAKQKLEMLQNYQDEITQAAVNRSLEGVTGFFLQSQNQYGQKIGQAIEQQAKQVQFIQTTEAHYLKGWQEALAEQKKFEALLERNRLKAQAKLAKQEQKNNDEYAARIYRNRIAGET